MGKKSSIEKKDKKLEAFHRAFKERVIFSNLLRDKEKPKK